MSLPVTLAVLVVAVAVAAFSAYRQRQPVEPGEPRLIPYVGLQIAAVVVALLMLAHLITLLTGTPFKGRMGGG